MNILLVYLKLSRNHSLMNAMQRKRWLFKLNVRGNNKKLEKSWNALFVKFYTC